MYHVLAHLSNNTVDYTYTALNSLYYNMFKIKIFAMLLDFPGTTSKAPDFFCENAKNYHNI